jgi:hypothetical protein
MASKRPTYPTKTNNPADPENVRKFLATEANEISEVLEDHAFNIDLLLAALGINEAITSLGEFISLEVLQAAYPDGAEGSYAVINDGLGGTPQVATYNEGTELWEMATPDAMIIWISTVSALPGTGVANKLYVALDTGIMYYWSTDQYVTTGGSAPVQKIVWIVNNSRSWRTIKGETNVGSGFEIGDEIDTRMVPEKRLVKGYVLNPSLTLPADFMNSAKFEKYIDTGAHL